MNKQVAAEIGLSEVHREGPSPQPDEEARRRSFADLVRMADILRIARRT